MKVYIAGKITGIAYEVAKAKFAKTQWELENIGISAQNIVNPMKLGLSENCDWDFALKTCLKQLDFCQAIYIQNDWRESHGARIEIEYAIDHDIDLYFEEARDLVLLKRKIAQKQIV